MKKLVTLFIATLLASSVSAQPDKDWWACQIVESVGMSWENGRWKATKFNLDPPFVLMSDGNGGLTEESVAKALTMVEGAESVTTCLPPSIGKVTCVATGSTLFFHLKRGMGGISDLYGATSESDNRDTLAVDAFTCTKG